VFKLVLKLVLLPKPFSPLLVLALLFQPLQLGSVGGIYLEAILQGIRDPQQLVSSVRTHEQQPH